MNTPKRWKITLEDAQATGDPIVVEYDHLMFDMDRGLTSVYRFGEARKQALKPNGHERIQINAWTGGEHWEDFVTRGEEFI